MTSTESLNVAFRIIRELMNKDCFDFLEVANSSYNERKEYLRDMIFEYFHSGEINLGGIIDRIDSDNYLFEGIASPETIENINNFFTNERLVADVILLMDEDMYFEYEKELNL